MASLADRPNSLSEQREAFLSEAARTTATQRALPLLVSYFAAAPTWTLETREQLSFDGPEVDLELSAFVRMRVALAAGRRLEPIVQRIMRRPSFNYAQQRQESFGTIRGQLDMPRYLRARTKVEAPRRFPIRIVYRRHDTPENVATAYAASWIVAELQRAPLPLIPRMSPEYREVLEQRSVFQRLLRQPVLAESLPLAHHVRRTDTLPALLDHVAFRSETGRISARDAYAALTDWFGQFSPEQSTAVPGSVEWVFYDERFDTKLFELWALQLLKEALTAELGDASAPMAPLSERGRRPLVEWNFGAVRVRLYFQASLMAFGKTGSVRWRYTEPDLGLLGAFPDITIAIDRVGSDRLVILVDPKLRQRSTAPTEEIYKLLGYFGNLDRDQRPLGAIVFYSPGERQAFQLETDAGGVVLALGTDPQDPIRSTKEFARLAELVRGVAQVDAALIRKLARAAATGAEAEEMTTGVRQRAAMDAMLQAASLLPPATLAPVRKSTAAQLVDVWDRLTDDTKTMLVTAEYFGQNAPGDADHSGPLLGLAAACERVLYEGLVDGLVAERGDLFEDGSTLGTIIRWLREAGRSKPRTAEGLFLAGYISSTSKLDGTVLNACTGDLFRLNVEFRIPAAHRELVEQNLWVSGRALVLDPSLGLLPRLARALSLESGN